MVKFIHTADLHLDSPFKGLSYLPSDLLNLIQDSSFASFNRLIDQAIKHQVDFMVIAGDLFDLESRSISSQNFLIQCFKKLSDNDIPVYIVYGNHDYMVDERLTIDFPNNVFVFGADVETTYLTTKAGETIALSGFSYHTQHVFDNKLSEFPPRSKDVDYHIGLYHGDLVQQSANYAPFNLGDIQKLHYDYYALGHIHKGQRLSENLPAYYSGNIQGRHINESGSKGGLLVELHAGDLRTEFIETSTIIWQALTIRIGERDSLTSIKEALLAQLDLDKELTLLRVNFVIIDKDNAGILDKLTAEEVTKLINSERVWVSQVTFETIKQLTPIEKKYPESFEKAKEVIASEKVDIYLDELSRNISNPYLEPYLSDQSRQELIKRAIKKMNLMDRR